MLLSLLYHRVGKGKYANPYPIFEAQFDFLAQNYRTVHPGDALKQKSLCLTFDDATFDFYHYIFPLLKKHQLKAVLAVPVAFIPEQTSFSPERRMQEDHQTRSSPAYCTWKELIEMQESGLVHIASHSVNHIPLTDAHANPEEELLSSKTILEERLNHPVTTFVYPYGKFNSSVHQLAKKHYRYIMRIGNALNASWQNSNQLIYRVNADSLASPYSPFSPLNQLKYGARYLLNTVRKK